MIGGCGHRYVCRRKIISRVSAAGREVPLSFVLFLKLTSFITKGLKENKNTQEKLFNHMCTFGDQAECISERRAISSYLDIDTRNNNAHLLNPTPLNCISGYTIYDDVGDRYLNKPPKIRLKLINGSISS